MNDAWKSEQVLIVGGGIGGLTTALALARQGIPSQVIEQAAEFKEIGAGIQIGPNAFWMLEHLGLVAPISALAVFPNNLIMRDSMTGEEVTRVPLGDAFRKRFHHPYALIHRADLLNVLLDACRKSKLIKLDASQKVVDVTETGNSITVKTASGSTYRGAALIGADGLWSTIRQIVVGDGKPKPAGHITYRAVLPRFEVPEEYRWQDMAFWAGEKVHLVLYPLRTGELFNLVAVFHSNRYEEGWDSFGDPAELHERFAGKCAPVHMLLDKIESWRMWVLCDRPPIKEWSKGRITLLGDAAHPMLQYLAQGACMSIEDAVCLADKVVAAKGDYASAFQAYQQARYLRTGRVQIMARIYGEFYHAGGVAKELRNLMLGGRSPEDAIAGMDWLYGKPEMLPAFAPSAEMEDNAEIGERLRLIRVAYGIKNGHARGMSQAEICRLTRISPQAWNNAETGDNRIGLDNAMAIAHHTGATLDYIYLGKLNNVPHGLAMEIEKLTAPTDA